MPYPIFAALPQPQPEQLVNARPPVDAVRSGSTVVTQGEPGEQYFVIVSGSARILRDGVEVALLGPGEGFGEIALLRPGPRRATLRAEGPLKLLALEREPFLLAVTGSTASLEEVNRTTCGLSVGVADLAHDVAECLDLLVAQYRPEQPLEAVEVAG